MKATTYIADMLHAFMEWVQKDLEPVNWLPPEDTLNDVVAKYIPGTKDGPKEGATIFLEKEHECDCAHRTPNYRYKAVLKDGRWVKEKMPWRLY